MTESRDRADEGGQAAMKPPAILVYAGGNYDLYRRIHDVLEGILPPSVHTLFHISPENIQLVDWIDCSSACIISADTRDFDDSAWDRISEFYNKSGKIIIAYQNNLESVLQAVLSRDSTRNQLTLLRLDRDIKTFMEISLNTLEDRGEINERYQTEKLEAGDSIVFSKKKDSPLMLCMKSGSASAVFSDVTTEELLAQEGRLLGEALEKVGIKVESAVQARPTLSMGYFIADEQWLNESSVLQYDISVGANPSLRLFRFQLARDEPKRCPPSAEYLPIQVLTKEQARSISTFDSDRYFAALNTHELGRKVLFIPVTTTTMDVSESLCTALPGNDGMVVIARQQTMGRGRGGKEFISPVGAATFTYTYTLPESAALAKHVVLGDGKEVFIQGLDEFGYLQVRNREDPEKFYSISDNDNTFDIMKGMIKMKLQ